MRSGTILACLCICTAFSACSGGNTSDDPGTSAAVSDTVVTAAEISAETAANETEKETEIETETETETENEETTVVPPDRETLKYLFDLWRSDVILPNGNDCGVTASPTGEAEAFYTDVDCDGEKEFCFVNETARRATMYVCEYNDGTWETADSLYIDPMSLKPDLAFLQTDEDGQYLFNINADGPLYGTESYTYKNGVENYFDIADLSDVGDDQDKYYEIIETAIAGYDNLQPLTEIPYAKTSSLYDICNMDHQEEFGEVDEEAAQAALEQFTSDVAALFE